MIGAADRLALVVGGTRGVGLLIAEGLLHGGYRVRVLARDPLDAAGRLSPSIEVVAGDVTRPEMLPAAMEGLDHIVFTAGVRSARPAPEQLVRATDYQGVLNVLAAARRAGFDGRFLYLNSLGVRTWSPTGFLLNLLKRNALVWRRRVEDDIRASGVTYTIIRVPFLLDRPGGERAIEVSQGALPLSARHRIARADAAEVFIAALTHPRAACATFEIVWGRGRRRAIPTALLNSLRPDCREA